MRFFGQIGFVEHQEKIVDGIGSGVWEDTVIEKSYYGDVVNLTRKYDTVADKVNDNITLSQSISIVADAYALDKFCFMKYVILNNVKWKITNIRVEYPRVTLTLGGLYTEEASNG